MVVLIHQTIHKRGLCEDRCREVRHRRRRVAGQCQIVETQVATAGLGDGHRIVALFQVVQTIGPRTGCALSIGIERYCNIQFIDDGVVDGHRTFEAAVITQHNRQRTACTVACQGIGLWGTCLIEGLIVEIPATMIPGEIIYLIERVIIVVRGIVGSDESRTVEC